MIGLGLNIAIRANMVGLPGDNINSYYSTSVTKNCRAPGHIDCAPGLKYLDTPEWYIVTQTLVAVAGMTSDEFVLKVSLFFIYLKEEFWGDCHF